MDNDDNVNVSTVGLRQDNKKILRKPYVPRFTSKQLTSLNLTDFYNSTVYLGNLKVIAASLDAQFHKAMTDCILKDDKNAQYRAGPLKKLDRCQNKGTVYMYTYGDVCTTDNVFNLCLTFLHCFWFNFVCKICFAMC